MIDIEKGRYWGEGITLVESCTRISPGCKNCWSLAREKRFHQGIEGEVKTHPERLTRFNTRKPKVFAVWNDLFHEAVPDEFIRRVFTLMAHGDVQQHTFLVLTKRPERMVLAMTGLWSDTENEIRFFMPKMWSGLTVCNQQEADQKIPIFLQVPGKKFLSIEPCLSEINLGINLLRIGTIDSPCGPNIDNIDAVLLGGETGPGARPLHPDWVRSIRDQCAAAGVPFFFKQWGEWLPANQGAFWENATLKNSYAFTENIAGTNRHVLDAIKIGRNKSGRLLDGRTHDELPWK